MDACCVSADDLITTSMKMPNDVLTNQPNETQKLSNNELTKAGHIFFIQSVYMTDRIHAQPHYTQNDTNNEQKISLAALSWKTHLLIIFVSYNLTIHSIF